MCNLTLYYSSVATEESEGEGGRAGGGREDYYGSKRTTVFTRAVKSLGTDGSRPNERITTSRTSRY